MRVQSMPWIASSFDNASLVASAWMNGVVTKIGFALVGPAALLLAAAVSAQDASELEARYWLALNEGKDVSSLEPLIDEWTRPSNTNRSLREVMAELAERLSEIEASEPLPAIVNSTNSENVVQTGNDWPSLGGDITHSGRSKDSGPTAGVEAWRYPIGWDSSATPLLEDGRVYVASPGLTTIILCLDRKTGKEQWAATNPRVGDCRQRRASSDLIRLGDDELGVRKVSGGGTVVEYVVVSKKEGNVLRRFAASPQEATFGPPTSPEKLAVSQIGAGGDILVQSLKSGGTWWRFPVGHLTAAPVAIDRRVYAAAKDGTLWGLNLDGALRVGWTFSIRDSWSCSPTGKGGVLFAGANDGAVYAIDAETGKPKWRTKVTEPNARARQCFSPVAVGNGRVYLGAYDGFLYAINAESGKLAWKINCGDWIRSRPFVAGDKVCVATLDGKLVAIKSGTNEAQRLWTTAIDRHPIYANLAGDEMGVLISTGNLDLVAVSLADGREQWRKSLIRCTRGSDGMKHYTDGMPEIMQAPITVAAGKLFVAGKDGFLHSVDASSGKRLWRFELGGRVSTSPTVREGRVFVGQFGGDGIFYAIDANSGLPLWSRKLGNIWAPPECDGQQLFVGNMEGTFYCLDPANGATQWTRKFSDGVYPAPTLDEDRVITGSWDGHYYALDRTDGKVIWAYSRPGYAYHIGGRPDSAAPVLVDGKVIVQVLGGNFVALNAETGNEEWEWSGKPWRICNVTAATDGRTVFVSIFGNAYERPYGIKLFGLDLDTGRELWEVPNAGGLTSPVITAGNRFVVGSMNSPFIYGYQLGNSPTDAPQMLWRFKTGGVMYESLPAVSGNLAFFLSNDGWLRAIQ
jgi:outer membrane protein assembly factor BamB